MALDLLGDINRAKTHFLAVIVRRNTTATNPYAMYSLVDAESLPFTVLRKKFEGTETIDGRESSPEAILESNAAERRKDGALGAVMVFSVESRKDESKTPTQAVLDVRELLRYHKVL